MTYARARLWTGISGVGFLVVLSLAALGFDLPHRWLNGLPAPAALAVTLAFYIAVSIPSDLFGGYLLPRAHGRSTQGFGSFAAAWLRGVLAQAALMLALALAILEAAQLGGTAAGIGCFLLLELVLLLSQAVVARLVGGFRTVPVTGTRFGAQLKQGKLGLLTKMIAFEAHDPGFVGGWVGTPKNERLIVPTSWLDELPEGVVSVELVRRAGVIATGARIRGAAVAIGWNTVGFSIASLLPGATLTDAPGLVTAAFWFTLWSFLGLLLLPSVNRPGVFEADRYARAQGVSANVLEEAIATLDKLQDDEPARSRWIERIFHPIPSVTSRLEQLASGQPRRGAWQCARTALYLSWAGLGFLARAVHCNAGRPELWVLFPGD